MTSPKFMGPYRIERSLGQGGMGEVYLGFDEQLGRPVAIKQIRADQLVGSTVAERFAREAQSIAKLRHPAIVQILQKFEENGSEYFVMEYVEGQTLAQLLMDHGPLPPARASALFHEIADGLAEAHRHDIVHRDIKARNLMVTPEGHARILDFGLVAQLDSTEASLSATGKILGTPQTMSPEQARGEKVDPRSDLFSLGAVLYEALTGKAPFQGDNLTATLLKVCMHHPPPPVELDSRIPKALSDLTVRLLQKEPDDRPQSASEVAAELRFDDSALATVQSKAATVGAQATVQAVRRRHYLLPALALLAVLAAAVGNWRSAKGPPPSPVTPTTHSLRPVVAILGLDNVSGRVEAEWQATAISEALTTAMRAGDRIRVINSYEVATEDLGKLSRLLGVSHVVQGTYGDFGEAVNLLRIRLQLQDPTNGEILISQSSTGTLTQLARMVTRPANAFREQLGESALTPAQELESEAVLPTSLRAMRPYAEGLDRLRKLDFLAAQNRLQAAVEAEPEHPMPHLALTEAWLALGYDRQALTAASRARELAGSLPELLQQRIEARYRSVAQEWHEASRIYETLFTSAPDDIDLGLRLADAQIEAGETSRAQVTLQALQALPEPLAKDPRIDLALARTAYHRGSYEKMLEFARRATAQAQELDAPLQVAEARLRETTALQILGEHEQAMASLAEAKELFESHGDLLGSAKALELIALATRDEGNLPGALKLFTKAQEEFEELGNRRRAAAVEGSLGIILAFQGHVQQAIEVLENALAMLRELEDQQEVTIVLNHLGYVFFSQGQWQAAIDKYSEVLDLSLELRDDIGAAHGSNNLGEILYIRGDLDEAQGMFDEALSLYSELINSEGIAYSKVRLGKVFAARGDLFSARRKYQEALDIQTDLGRQAAAAETRVELALIELVDGKPKVAEALAREAEEVLRNKGWSDLAILARAALARAQLVLGHLTEAQETMAEIEAAAPSQDRRVRWIAAIAVARVRAASPEMKSTAIADLQQVANDALEAGYVEEHLEARLAIGQIAATQGGPNAETLLVALEGEAKSRGYDQIAHRAKQTRGH